jgi:peptidylprolyl isomerase
VAESTWRLKLPLTSRRYRPAAMFRRSPLAPVLAAVALTASLVACSSDDDASSSGGSVATTVPSDDSVTDMTLVPATPPASVPPVSVPASAPTTLQVTKVKEGSGTPAVDGDILVVDYVGVRQPDGKQFDTSYGKTPFVITLGMGQVIKGWDQGLVGVTNGERVQLDIPADLAYGDAPPDTTVIQKGDALSYVIDVRGVIPAPDATKQPVAADLPATAAQVPEAVASDITVGTGDTLEAGHSGVFLLVYFDGATKEVQQTTWPDNAQLLAAASGDVASDPAAGLAGMKVGGRRALTIPAAMAGTDSDLIIVVDLLAVV